MMATVKTLLLSIAASCCISSGIFGQRTLVFETFPDSADVLKDGICIGHTPFTHQYSWKGEPLAFSIRKKGYKTVEYTFKEKPERVSTFLSSHLERDYPIKVDSLSPWIAFEKLHSSIAIGKVVGHSSEYVPQRELTWEGFVSIDEAYHIKSTTDVLKRAGFNVVESDEEYATFDQAFLARARFLLSATVRNISVEISVNEKEPWQRRHVARINLEIEWKVTDNEKRQAVSTETTQSYSVHRAGVYIDNLIFGNAYEMALEEYLLSGKLAKLVNSVDGGERTAKPQLPTTLVSTKIPRKHPESFASKAEMIEAATSACATIETELGHGSGVFIGSNGYVLTAYHVIEEAYRVEVVLPNGARWDAEIVAFDRLHDVTLLKIPGKGFDALPIGASANSPIGTDVFTIGTPSDIELGQSVSKGIISGKREFDGIAYLQTDVSVSPGNSGGPLINSRGEIVGIVQKKLVGKGIEGVGFGLPIEVALRQLNITVE